MKIVHISDLHIDAVNKKENYIRTKLLLEYIAEMNFDHLIITGDITENGDDVSLELTRKTLKQFGLLNENKTTLIIGNHDIYGGVHLAEDVVNYPVKCRNTSYSEKIRKFESYFPETFQNTYQPLTDSLYPFVKEFDNFILIGVNSIAEYSLLKNPFASNGIVKSSQLTALEGILSSKMYSDKNKIVLIHHHFCKDTFENENSDISLWQKIERRTMKLYNKKELTALFKKYKVELVLHGHLHETRTYKRKHILFLNAGGSVLSNTKNTAKINLITIGSSNKINYETHSVNFEMLRSLQILRSIQKEQVGKPKNQQQRVPLTKEICLN